MEKRIKDKINEIEECLEKLYSSVPQTYEEYLEDFVKKAFCERYFEKIVEAMIDLTFLMIRHKKLDSPRDDEGAFQILANKNIISQELADKLKDAKGMRNFIIYEYGEIDDLKVYTSITEELEKDTREFLNTIKNKI